jgi:hypothetical protein
MNPDQERVLLDHVANLVARERDLRAHLASPSNTDRINERASLRQLEEDLDQCWDLLRQRRALRAVHLDPDEARPRPIAQVENYLPHPGAVP